MKYIDFTDLSQKSLYLYDITFSSMNMVYASLFLRPSIMSVNYMYVYIYMHVHIYVCVYIYIFYICIYIYPWRRAWQPTPIFLPGEGHGQTSLRGYHPWGHKQSDMTDATWHMHTHTHKVVYIFKLCMCKFSLYMYI